MKSKPPYKNRPAIKAMLREIEKIVNETNGGATTISDIYRKLKRNKNIPASTENNELSRLLNEIRYSGYLNGEIPNCITGLSDKGRYYIKPFWSFNKQGQWIITTLLIIVSIIISSISLFKGSI